MSKVYRLPSSGEARSEAADWITKLDRGLAPDEEAQLRDWLGQNARNRNDFLAMAQFWDQMNSLSWLSDLFDSPRATAAPGPRWAFVAAVAVACLTVIGLYAWINPSWQEAPATAATVANGPSPAVYETAVGEQSTIRLAEGTEIVLNTDSQLQVRLTRHHRVLSLTRGEVHVNVSPDQNRPLSVIVRDKVFQAVGTAFSITLEPTQRIELVVTEGRVLVGSQPAPAAGREQISAPILPTSSTAVDAGQELRITQQGSQKLSVPPEEIEARLSWRQGNLIFRGESLEEALTEVSRYTTIEFVFLNDSIRQEPIAGRFKAGDVETLLAGLRENVGIAYERTDDDRILLSKLR